MLRRSRVSDKGVYAILFAALILASFIIPYTLLSSSLPYVLFTFWSLATIISILLAYLALRR
ncbi:MAG TPA: hypothetical protein VNL13_09010 [Sulfolobales archaeon]|nr:hypothetical protein [Sulfolobales archaeon]